MFGFKVPPNHGEGQKPKPRANGYDPLLTKDDPDPGIPLSPSHEWQRDDIASASMIRDPTAYQDVNKAWSFYHAPEDLNKTLSFIYDGQAHVHGHAQHIKLTKT